MCINFPEPIECWMNDNAKHMYKAMEEQRRKMLTLYNEDSSDLGKSWLNPQFRWLSEMPLCGAWQDIVPPKGFEVANSGWVSGPSIDQSTGETYISWHGHVFAVGPDKTILCITPGQFIQYADHLEPGPGRRIRDLQEKAHGFVKVLNQQEGIAALYGNREEIYKNTGILYWTKQPFSHFITISGKQK